MSFIIIGKIKDFISIRVLEQIDLVSNYSYYAVRVEIFDEESENTFFANIPAEELSGLINAMQTIVNKFYNSKTDNYTEVLFASSQGFSTGCFWYENDKKWYQYIVFSQQPESQKILGIRDYKKFLKLIEQAEQKIND